MPAQKDLETLFNAKSLAVVGALQEPQKLGSILEIVWMVFLWRQIQTTLLP